jgi:hypothetical protein
MASSTRFKRPTNLSRWVFFATEKTQNFDPLAGGNREYIQRVRAANRPVIYIFQSNRGKYRFGVSIDMIEGFDGQHRVKLSHKGAKLAFEILHSVESVKSDDGSLFPFFSFGNARYCSIDDAVIVANRLAALQGDCFVFFD